MKQPFASAARLRGGGPILTNGSMTMFWLGSPPPRIVIGRPCRIASAERAEIPFLLSLSWCLSGGLSQHNTVRDLAGGDHAPERYEQLASERVYGDHNRLGYALMLCYLRHPGRAAARRRATACDLARIRAEQIGVLPESIDEYLAAERNRQRHAIECQEQSPASSVRQTRRRRIGDRPCCRKPSRTIGSPIWPSW